MSEINMSEELINKLNRLSIIHDISDVNEDIIKMKQEELVIKCNELNILKYKKKKELIKLIQEHQNDEYQEKLKKCKKKIDQDLNLNKNYILNIENTDGLTYLTKIDDNSIDLIIADPPYKISKKSGMDKHYNNIKSNKKNGITYIKTDEDWEDYKKKKNIIDDIKKENYKRFGSTWGKKYSIRTDYGVWDSEFAIESLEPFIDEYYKKLKKGGSLIIFFDLWKISILKELMEKYKFKQIKFIQWIKPNPTPLGCTKNYLCSIEIALVGIKDKKPAFNGFYDNGIYIYPPQNKNNKNKDKDVHSTQKNLNLIEDLIRKHSNENDTVLDTFLGSGTTAIACKNTKRYFKGCELEKEYYDQIIKRLNS